MLNLRAQQLERHYHPNLPKLFWESFFLILRFYDLDNQMPWQGGAREIKDPINQQAEFFLIHGFLKA